MSITSLTLIVVPTFLFKLDIAIRIDKYECYSEIVSAKTQKLVLVGSTVFIMLWFIENMLTYESLFPIWMAFSAEGAIEHYSSSYPLLNLIMPLFKWLIPLFALDSFIQSKKTIFLVVFFVLIVVPLTRGQRSTTLLFFMVFLVSAFPVFIEAIKKSRKTFLLIIVFFIAIVLLMTIVQDVRSGDYGYGKLIGMNDSGIIRSAFNWYYGYTAMSFDTLQRSLSYWKDIGAPKYFGLGFIAGLSNLTKLHHIFSLQETPYSTIMNKRVYYSLAVVLPTALHQMILDFGFLGCFLTILFQSVFNYLSYRLFLKNKYNFPLFGIAMIFTYYMVLYSAFLLHNAVGTAIVVLFVVNKRNRRFRRIMGSFDKRIFQSKSIVNAGAKDSFL